MGSSEREQDRVLWTGASTFEELCQLGAEFLEGDLAYFPGWMAPDIDEETDPIVVDLCVLCRAGFLPLASQPGHPRRSEHDERLWSRRAFVTGFARPAAAERLHGLPGIVVRRYSARDRGGAREPVGLVGGEPYMWAGEGRGPEELELFAEDLGKEAFGELSKMEYLSVHEVAWGGGTQLFARLAGALGTLAAPATGGLLTENPPSPDT